MNSTWLHLESKLRPGVGSMTRILLNRQVNLCEMLRMLADIQNRISYKNSNQIYSRIHAVVKSSRHHLTGFFFRRPQCPRIDPTLLTAPSPVDILKSLVSNCLVFIAIADKICSNFITCSSLTQFTTNQHFNSFLTATAFN